MRRHAIAVGDLALGLSATMSGCGSGDTSRVATDPVVDQPTDPASDNVLTFTGAHGRTFRISPRRVRCAVGDYGHGVKTLQIKQVDMSRRSILVVQVVPVSRPTTYSLPLDSGDMERGPRNAYLFLGSPHKLEVSTIEELQHPTRDGGGELRVLEASCDPVRLRMTIHGTLGSEYTGEELTVTGGIDLSGS